MERTETRLAVVVGSLADAAEWAAVHGLAVSDAARTDWCGRSAVQCRVTCRADVMESRLGRWFDETGATAPGSLVYCSGGPR